MSLYKDKLRKYRFEIRHITIFVTVLIAFQIIMAYFQKSSMGNFLEETQTWFQKYSAERLAIVTSTSMELMFENLSAQQTGSADERKTVYSFNTIVKQQLVQKNVEDICLILVKNHKLYVIDSGQKLNSYLNNSLQPYESASGEHSEGVHLFHSMKDKMKGAEVIYSTLKDNKTYNILVPFVPDGEYRGVMYMRISPDFSFLTKEVTSNFDNEAIIYSLLIFLGLIAMFMVSSQAVKERNEAQAKLFEEHEENLRKQIKLEKESLFTKRIYHTHHKAEKIIGFIKEDVRQMDCENIKNVRQRVITYSNFISRIIYDMKWYDQEINTIINPMFRTDINNVLQFIVEYVFLRISSKNEMFDFKFDFDPCLPNVSVNEFVVWEILEPLIQNSIDHGSKKSVLISISTRYDSENRKSYITIRDNGVGIKPDLLEVNDEGIKRLFLENESTKKMEGANSGYGCYIAYQMAVGRCGWALDAENLTEGGCQFTITIKN
ncbi:MAG: sensor histidine kinase [Syntrophothermus sp.]